MGEGELQLPLRTTASLPPLSVACNIFDGNFELLMNIETAWIFVPGFHIPGLPHQWQEPNYSSHQYRYLLGFALAGGWTRSRSQGRNPGNPV